MQLVIVELPAKAKTIEKYLGKDFKVLASYGHVRDLPPKDGSVDPDADFAMEWELYRDKQSRFKEIADAAKGATRLVLATDPDREGEAISWHVLELLKKRKSVPSLVDRVTFNAITKQAVTEAMTRPRELDQPLIDAYLARRALDYLFGFTLSPVLWRKLPGAKSAGRVQSVALRLIVEREREIEAFRADEYWSVVARMQHDGTEFDARLVPSCCIRATTLQYSSARKASISRSRSTIRRRATDCTRPALLAPGSLRQPHRRQGETEQVIERTASEVSVNQRLIELAWASHRLGVLKVTPSTRARFCASSRFEHVPADRLTFAVRVSRQHQPGALWPRRRFP